MMMLTLLFALAMMLLFAQPYEGFVSRLYKVKFMRLVRCTSSNRWKFLYRIKERQDSEWQDRERVLVDLPLSESVVRAKQVARERVPNAKYYKYATSYSSGITYQAC